MARLTIEHDPGHDGADGARPRKPSAALRLDGRAWLRVKPEELAELDVTDGEEVDDARRAALEAALGRLRARLFVVRSLSARAQSRAELERKLAARSVPAAVAREAIEQAAGYGYVDDGALAGQLARGMRGRGYGRRRAEQKLRERGIERAVAAAALDEAYGAEDEAALARDALGRRSVADDRARSRALAFLARRGFSASAAHRAVRAAAEGER
jgi:regulatory protein